MIVTAESYRKLVGDEVIDRLEQASAALRGVRVLHVCSSGRGGGVAEILKCQAPLMESQGLRVQWRVLHGTNAFLRITKDIHRGLQGFPVSIAESHWQEYHNAVLEWASGFRCDADVVIVHDPQPLPLIAAGNGPAKWIWRCHIDMATPQKDVWDKIIERYLFMYHGSIFSTDASARSVPTRRFVFPPSIDPLADKNRDLPPLTVEAVRRQYGLGHKPFLLQVARFDHFKDPVGVIKAFRQVRREYDCMLVLATGPAEDDPEQEEVMAEVQEEAKGDPDIKLLFIPADSHLDVNALQRAATVVVQKSIREGFGLPVAEAMWKSRPVVGGLTSGISLQIENGVSGYLVSSIPDAADRICQLLGNDSLRQSIGAAAKESVRSRFLITRELLDHYTMLSELRCGAADTRGL